MAKKYEIKLMVFLCLGHIWSFSVEHMCALFFFFFNENIAIRSCHRAVGEPTPPWSQWLGAFSFLLA